jgi:hypothetical protein
MAELRLHIDRLLIELPGGDGQTATELVRLVARRLAGAPIPAARPREAIRVEVDAAPAGERREELAARIAHALLAELGRVAG